MKKLDWIYDDNFESFASVGYSQQFMITHDKEESFIAVIHVAGFPIKEIGTYNDKDDAFFACDKENAKHINEAIEKLKEWEDL